MDPSEEEIKLSHMNSSIEIEWMFLHVPRPNPGALVEKVDSFRIHRKKKRCRSLRRLLSLPMVPAQPSLNEKVSPCMSLFLYPFCFFQQTLPLKGIYLSTAMETLFIFVYHFAYHTFHWERSRFF